MPKKMEPTTRKFSMEVRDLAVRMVPEHEGEHLSPGGRGLDREKFDCSPHMLRGWVQRADRNSGQLPDAVPKMAVKLKAL